MNEKLMQAQDIFLSRMNQICSKFGLNNIMAQLYAILYLNPRPISLDDMVERLKISKGSASVNIRALERYGAVRKVWVKGSRKDYYEAELDISKVICERITSLIQGRLLEVADMLKFSYEAVIKAGCAEKEESESIENFQQKLDELKRLHNKAQSLFNFLNSEILNNVLDSKIEENTQKEIAGNMHIAAANK